jgi:hypothetical protein
MAKKLPLVILFILGILILIVSILFRIQHWPGAIDMFWTSFGCLSIFFILILVEIFRSKKANSNAKVFWGLPYAAVLLSSLFIFPEYSVLVFVMLGAIYLLGGRKHFLFSGKEKEPIEFDSI